MRAHGLEVRSSTPVERVERAGGRLVVMTATEAIPADAVLYATGRAPIPNTKGIGLDEQGVAMSGAARSWSIVPTAAACPASTRSATAATMPAPASTRASST